MDQKTWKERGGLGDKRARKRRICLTVKLKGTVDDPGDAIRLPARSKKKGTLARCEQYKISHPLMSRHLFSL